MIETKRKQVGKHTYVVTQFGAKRGRDVLARLLRMLAPAAGELAEDKGIAAALGRFAEGLTPEDFAILTDAFAERTKVVLAYTEQKSFEQDLAPIFDDHFVGLYDEMLGWLAFAVEVNYGSFFGASGALAKAGAMLQPKTDPASIGGPGGLSSTRGSA